MSSYKNGSNIKTFLNTKYLFLIFHINILVNATLGYQKTVIWSSGVGSKHFYKF